MPVLGITGTGGAGKSSLTDELVRRFLFEFKDKTIAILSIDPTKQKTGGALLGDRIRMNAIHDGRVFMRSLATRGSRTEISASIRDAIAVVKAAGYDLIIVETSGIGQGDAEIADVADVSLYVMTSEYGAPSQLEKIDMIDFADVVAINKFDRKGSEDALRHVRKQYQRSRNRFEEPAEAMPVYGTIASQFNDLGTNTLFAALIEVIANKCKKDWQTTIETSPEVVKQNVIIPPEQTQYLRDIVLTVRNYKRLTDEQVEVARKLFQITGTIEAVEQHGMATAEVLEQLEHTKQMYEQKLHPACKEIVDNWPTLKEAYKGERMSRKSVIRKL